MRSVLNYHPFEGFFFTWAKWMHCSVRTKKLINCRSLVNLQELLFLLVFQVFKPSLKKPWNKAEILLDWRRKIKKRANQLKGLDDNSTETQVSFDDFLMVVVIPDNSSKYQTFMDLIWPFYEFWSYIFWWLYKLWSYFDHCMNLIIIWSLN